MQLNKNITIQFNAWENKVYVCLNGRKRLLNKSFRLYMKTELPFYFYIFYRVASMYGHSLSRESYNKLLECKF